MLPRSRSWVVRLRPRRSAATFAWSLAAAATLVTLTSAVAAFAHAFGTGEMHLLLSHQSLLPFVTIAFAALGALVASRHTRNIVGWLLLAVAALSSLNVLANTGQLVWASPGPWRIGDARAWLAWARLWVWIPATFVSSVFVFLYFPDGRLPSPRWRPVSWAAWLSVAILTLGVAFHPGRLEMWGFDLNPWGVPALAPALSAMVDAGVAGGVVATLAAITAIVVRFHAARGVLRLQMKWMVYAAALLLASAAASAGLTFAGHGSELAQEGAIAIGSLGSLGVAAAAAIAILRHRLYGIDLIIRRTLVYGTLTALVAAIYVLAVGAGSMAANSDAHLAALALAAALAIPLYRPARRRVERLAGRIAKPWADPEPPGGAGGVPRPGGVAEPDARAVPVGGRLPAAGLRLAHALWPLAALGALALVALAVPGYLARRPLGGLGERLLYAPTPAMLVANQVNVAGSVLVVAASLGLAWTVYRGRGRQAMALFVAYYMVAHALVMGGVVEMLEPRWPAAEAVNSFVFSPALFAPLTFVLLALFPSGRFEPRWIRWPALGTCATGAITALVLLASHWDPSRAVLRPEGIVLASILAASLPLAAYAQAVRYRRAGTEARRQIKWLLYGYALTLLLAAASSVPWAVALSLPAGSTMPWWVPLSETVWLAAVAVLPVSMTVAILRFRLFEIDQLINRTLVYGALTGLVVVLYVLVVGAAGALSKSRESLFIALLASGVVAALFQPLRERLQRGVNRLVYGERDDPYAVLSRLGRRLGAALAPETVLPTLAETVAQALMLPYVAVRLRYGETSETVAEFGRPGGALVDLPLVHQGETVGALTVAPRPGEGALGEGERNLLEAIARQASVAAYSVRLTTELKRSRERLVTTREEERRRLRRDLHDGLGPLLASMSLRLEAARDRLHPSQRQVDALLGGLADQLDVAVGDIRRLVYGLRPPALDELGLVGALREQARQYEGPKLRVDLRATPETRPLPAAAEVAAYRIVQEALTNVVRHSGAERCMVRLEVGEILRVSVEDDGDGLPAEHGIGIGLRSMQERAAELGGTVRLQRGALGGLRVEARLPLPEGPA